MWWVLRCGVWFGGGFLFFLLTASGLKFFERFEIVFAVAAEAVFVKAEVLELAFVFEGDLEFEEMGRDGIGEFHAADFVDAGFKRLDAHEAPFGVDD